MTQSWSLTKLQFLGILAYSAVFPVTGLFGGAVMDAGMFITMPFLPLAWIGGMTMVGVTGTNNTYPLGAFLAIFIQVWLMMLIRASIRGKKRVQ